MRWREGGRTFPRMIITESGIRSRPALARWLGRYALAHGSSRHGSANGSDADACRSLLDEIVRDGARQMLAAALKAEVAAYVEQFADQLDEDGRRLVVRNGDITSPATCRPRPGRSR